MNATKVICFFSRYVILGNVTPL